MKIVMASTFVKNMEDLIEKYGDLPMLLDVKVDDKKALTPISTISLGYIGESQENSDTIYVISNYNEDGEFLINAD